VPAAERIELHPTTPWSLRIFNWIPLPTLWIGVGISLALFALFLLYTAVFSDAPGRLAGMASDPGAMWGAELIQDLFLGFTLAISAASVRGARRDVRDLRPYLGSADSDPAAIDREVFGYSRVPLLAAGLVVGGFSAFLSASDPSLWADSGMPGWTHPTTIWLAGRNFLNWWVVARAMLLELTLSRAFSRLGERLEQVDLLDRNPLAPFSRRALRNVLLWMLLAAFLSLTYLGEGWSSDLLALALGTLFVFALTVFALPLMGVRARIRGLKQVELDRVRIQIRAEREQLFAHSAAEGRAGGRLADLVSYEGRISAVAEWPIDGSTWLRLALYLAIGFGSWIGAAVVERVLDTALG